MNLAQSLWHAARPRTLPLSLSGVIVGHAIAYYLGVFDDIIFGLNLTVVMLLQILSNFANDLGDSEHGVDNADRIGPKRAIQSGLISKDQMKGYIKSIVIITLLLGTLLVVISNLLWYEKMILLLIGLVAIGSAMAYTRGKISYGYRGYGDIFVFVFFGLVSVLGSLFLCIHKINNAALLPAIGIGLLSVSVLHLNNMRDRSHDALNAKRTLAVKIGRENGRIYFLLIVLLGVIFWACFPFTQNQESIFRFLYWIGLLPILFILNKFFKIKEDKQFDTLLKPMAVLTFITSVLFFISQILSNYYY